MRAIVDKFETKFTLLDVPVPKRRRIARSEEIIAAVSGSIQNVYANKPATLDDLKDNIQRKIGNVPVEMCARVVENWVQGIDRCKRARGGHMTDIVRSGIFYGVFRKPGRLLENVDLTPACGAL